MQIQVCQFATRKQLHNSTYNSMVSSLTRVKRKHNCAVDVNTQLWIYSKEWNDDIVPLTGRPSGWLMITIFIVYSNILNIQSTF